ncbi:ATP phosphoribosyltransferase regulatory subunit, partial [Candidatus Berkelbacteria bacterium]|nr:ATP phosphoribosyltransferase regulatory subunit [Candidatus Berkelbacteria bacterium]
MANDQFLPLSGFRDNTNVTKERVATVLRETFLSYGYQYLETPALERQEILLGKMGDEAQKLLYLFEDNGERKVGLRYDLTVPLSRFVASNLGELTLPYKRYEIGSVWRAERPQKGRYRQFTQADIDVIGANGNGAEKEFLEIIGVVATKLELDLTVLLNDRRIVKELLVELKIEDDQQTKLLQLLDKQDKISGEEMEKGLQDTGLSDVQRGQIKDLFLTEPELKNIEEIVGTEVTANLKELIAFAKSIKLNVKFAPNMVRGLDYYTGTIIEAVVPDGAGSVIGGGAYDSLIENLTGKKVNGIGISFGVDRIADYIIEIENFDKPMPLFILNLP